MYHNEDKRWMTPENLDRIRRFRLMDDTFFAVCFSGDKELAEFILRIMLDKQDLRVIRSVAQYTIKNLLGHSVTFDAYAMDSKGKKYNIEMQRADTGAIPRRARYHSSMIDAQSLPVGQDYPSLPETYVIFITENDVMGDGLALYHVERTVVETGKSFGDGAHVMYMNASYTGDSDVGRLIHDLQCANPDDMYYSVLAQKTRYFKEDKKEVRNMCRIMEEMCQEVREEVMAEAEAKFAQKQAEAEAKAKEEMQRELKEREQSLNTAILMIKDGMSVEKIAQYTRLPLARVQELTALITN